MYRVYKIDIGPAHSMYEYFEKTCIANTNLYNRALFVCRQVLSGLGKEPEQRQKNEREVLAEIEKQLPKMQERRKKGGSFAMPVKGHEALSYEFLNSFFYVSEDENYFASVFPRQCSQQTLKQVYQDMKSFYASIREYKLHPEKFQGRPKLPKYKDKGKPSTFNLTNQTCQIKTKERGERELQFPYYNERRQVIPLGEYVQSDWRLKQITVIPQHGKFRVTLILEDGKEEADIVEAEKNPQRICAIDLGVKNFAAMSNNIGKPAMLFKGGVVINANHHCTKYFGKNQSAQARSAAQKSGNAQTSGTAQTSDTTETPEMTKQMKNLLNKRANILSDYIHKTSKLIINWCKENQIDTLVVGNNKQWKQKAELGKNTGKFEQIPYSRFIKTLEYLCKREGILFKTQEESYTSKASFLDNDFIPVYNPASKQTEEFSGRRDNRLYTTKSGRSINADLNGSANIGRKAFPEQFTTDNCDILSRPVIVRHPDHYLSEYSKHSPNGDIGSVMEPVVLPYR